MSRAIAWTRASMFERPTSSRLRTSYGAAPSVRFHVVVQIAATAEGSSNGLVGLGEASPLQEFTGETAQGIYKLLNDTYLGALTGRDPTEIGALCADLERLRPGNPS